LVELKSSLKKNLDVKQMLTNSFKPQTNVTSSGPTQINDLSGLIKKRKADDSNKTENKEKDKNKSEDKKEEKEEVKTPETKKIKIDNETKEKEENKEAK